VTVARRLLLTYLTISVFVLAAVVIPLGRTFADREKDRLVFDIERDAQAVASLVEDALEAGEPPRIDDVLADYAHTGGRIVVADAQGVSVADSDRPEGQPRDFSTRPEFAAALDGARSAGTRASETLGTELMYVALPVASGGVVHGAVRVSYPTSTLDARVSSMWLRLAALSAVVLVTVAAVGLLLARSVTRPVRRLQAVAGQLAGGDLGARVQLDGGAPELRDLADTFNRTADRLAQLVTAQKRFVADASHQLRTPLTALRLRLETLSPEVTPGALPKLEAALAETQRLARLVESLLVLARSDAAPARAAVDLGAVVAQRGDAGAARPRDRDVAITVDGPATPTWVGAVAGALDQILDNLMANALDVAPAGTTVAVRVVPRDDAVELHVIDRGPGMAPDVRAHAFERFWRPAGATGQGFGLGLAIVGELVTACGGEASLEPGPGGGGLDAVVRLLPGGRNSGPPAEGKGVGIPNPALTSG
jgi:signal transduction histidine kinase